MNIYEKEKEKEILLKIYENFQKLQNRITVSEKELARILGEGFSVSTLEKMRREGNVIFPFLQPCIGGRVLYPLVYIVDFLSNHEIKNKYIYIEKQLDSVKKGAFINECKIANIFGISPSTLSHYYKQNLFIRKINDRYYKKSDIANWVVDSCIKVIK